MGLRIAIEGCGHGELDRVYSSVKQLEELDGKKVDLVVCCGDFQSVRNLDDLECMACPVKYRKLGSFYEYYSGVKKAPYPTVFVGGNHEAINYLRELYYGGWVAPNIYFMGYSGVIHFGGIRIAGISGIFKGHDYLMGHHESPPYDNSSMRSAYHVRCMEVSKLMSVTGHVDVFLSHDWPAGITSYGDVNDLVRRKRFLARDIEQNSLGSPPLMSLLKKIQPSYWFSAHLHTKFAALVPHSDTSFTRFLSLDKCLPGRDFLQIVDFPEASGPKEFSYDEQWLAIIKKTHPSLSFDRSPITPPPPVEIHEEELRHIREVFQGDMKVPENFVCTAPPFDTMTTQGKGNMPMQLLENPQTKSLMDTLEIEFPARHASDNAARNNPPPNPEMIDIDDDDIDPAIQAILH
ncbi:hypothetical protein M9434_006844 [Picochlorum sp. BPE23]|nr:hypothetical protein M9434_006844 [Picochlorum sp. BPE23]